MLCHYRKVGQAFMLPLLENAYNKEAPVTIRNPSDLHLAHEISDGLVTSTAVRFVRLMIQAQRNRLPLRAPGKFPLGFITKFRPKNAPCNAWMLPMAFLNSLCWRCMRVIIYKCLCISLFLPSYNLGSFSKAKCSQHKLSAGTHDHLRPTRLSCRNGATYNWPWSGILYHSLA